MNPEYIKDTECPYCTVKSLEPLEGPDEVYFLDEAVKNSDELNMTKWRAFRCDTCSGVCILDVAAI